jgi:aminoglycoside phosphotransferase (APT) family kinase protein
MSAHAPDIHSQNGDVKPDRWVVVTSLPGGMQAGAWRVRADGEPPAVLKWIDVDAADAAAVVAHARDAGYPTPRWLDHGTTDDGRSWCVQELVEGTPMGNLDVAGAHLIVELVARQRTITPPTERSWPALLRTDELVHSDLNVQNILLRDGAVVAVIDFEEAARGGAALDLLSPAANAAIWHSDPAAIEILHRFARESYTDDEIAAAAAIVADCVHTWYRHAIPDRYEVEIRESIERWRASLPA